MNNYDHRKTSIDALLLSEIVNLATTEEQLRWALTQPMPFVAVPR